MGTKKDISEDSSVRKQRNVYLVGNGSLLADNVSLLGTTGGDKHRQTSIRH